jgi:hypothetical protein
MREETLPREARTFITRKSSWTKQVDVFHDRFMDAMLRISGPYGFDGAVREPSPVFGCAADGLPYSSAGYNVKGRIRGVKFIGNYVIPDPFGHTDPEKSDQTLGGDSLTYEWKLSSKKIDHHFALCKNLPEVLESFEAQFCTVSVCFYDQAYQGGYHGDCGPFVDEGGYSPKLNQTYNRLQADPVIHVDGWNNIYTIYPAQYWDGGRCVRALGYDRDEVIRRLDGKVPLVRPLLDGVYCVLNDDPNISYDEYYAMNVTIKGLLDLV